jgi:uncharacterized protein YyaL (SSP411 family)
VEKSPYLRQHAYNPVDWYPWGEEAMNRAREEQKPLFLSVGYSTCHWCHVMERESFENDSIARILNQYFIPVKVDREERPDIDRVYMTALQAMGQNGGWPMSMFLTPDLHPFYGGTYFPPESRYGRAGFQDILLRIHEAWINERTKVMESATRVTTFLREAANAGTGAAQPGEEVLHRDFAQFQKAYDGAFGGFGRGPKFPRPAVFQFLLRYHRRTGNTTALDMTTHTLQKMALGGLCDQIGGGFHRYSVDGEWRVPHFEKMLYDQAQLLEVFLDVYRLTRDDLYAAVARGIADYVIRDLCHPEGAFFSAEDADSPRPEDPTEAGEGAFYVWSRREIERLLGDDAGVFCLYYGVEEEGNAPIDPQHEFTGRNILYVASSVEDTARISGRMPDRVRLILARARRLLFETRSRRPRPHRDEKIITGWNGLMAGSLARAGAVLGRDDYTSAGAAAARFVLARLQTSGARLLRRFSDGEARFDAQLQDYAFLIQGLLDLFTFEGDGDWLQAALELAGTQETEFRDERLGGYFDSAGDDPTILVRMKELYDGAEPSGNAVTAMNLIRLARLTGDPRWESRARATVEASGGALGSQPVAMPAMAAAVSDLLSPGEQIVLAESDGGDAVRMLLHEVYSRYLPAAAVIRVRPGDRRIGTIAPATRAYGPIGGKPAVYVCRDFVCRLPVTDADTLGRVLDERSP